SGAPVQDSGGEMSLPSSVYVLGMVLPWVKALLLSCMTAAPFPCKAELARSVVASVFSAPTGPGFSALQPTRRRTSVPKSRSLGMTRSPCPVYVSRPPAGRSDRPASAKRKPDRLSRIVCQIVYQQTVYRRRKPA